MSNFINLCDLNNCPLSESLHNVLVYYMKTLDEDIKTNQFKDESDIGNMLILSEVLPFLSDKSYWHQNISLLLEKIDQSLPDYVHT